MGLIRRTVTPAIAAASRANGRQGAGPVTARGKSISRLNAGKHWGRAEGIRDLMSALGEDPAEFQKVREKLYRTLAPTDDFEAMLVDDMADIHWRLRRLIRGEAAQQARYRRMEMQRLDERDAARENGGSLQGPERALLPMVGFANLPDSPAKFYRVLEILKTLAMLVQYDAVGGEGLAYLKTLYGPRPSVAGKNLISDYELYIETRKSRDEPKKTASRDALLKAIEAELAWFEKRAAAERLARAELNAPCIEAQILRSKLSPDSLMLWQERLERRFEKKWKMLLRYRRMRLSEEEREAMFGQEGGAQELDAQESYVAGLDPPDGDSVGAQLDAPSTETPGAGEIENKKVTERTRQIVENKDIPFLEDGRTHQHIENKQVKGKGCQVTDKAGDRPNGKHRKTVSET
jgi:hypothetical protein